jgi:hypothetical protein
MMSNARRLKMKIKTAFINLIVLLMAAGQLMASGKKLGTAGAVELTIPMGAQNVAMAGSNIANITGTEAMYWNPAGLAGIQKVAANFSYMNYFADMNISYFAVASKVQGLGVMGVTLQAMNIGDIAVTTIENPEGTGEVLSPNFLTLSGTYARAFTERINFGLNAKLVSERVGNMSATALAFDFGLQYVSPIGVDFGIVMRNYGTNLKYDGTGIEFDSDVPWANPNATSRKTKLDMASHELPISMSLGAGYRMKLADIHGLNLTGVYTNSSYDLDYLNAGAEYNLNDLFFVRGGYVYAMYPEGYPENAKEYQYGLTAGFGAKISLNSKTICFDYAYRSMDLFDANQYFSIGIGL